MKKRSFLFALFLGLVAGFSLAHAAPAPSLTDQAAALAKVYDTDGLAKLASDNPDSAAQIAAAAAAARHNSAGVFAVVIAKAVPAQAAAIAAEVVRAVPKQAAGITAAVERAVPGNNTAIATAVAGVTGQTAEQVQAAANTSTARAFAVEANIPPDNMKGPSSDGISPDSPNPNLNPNLNLVDPDVRITTPPLPPNANNPSTSS